MTGMAVRVSPESDTEEVEGIAEEEEADAEAKAGEDEGDEDVNEADANDDGTEGRAPIDDERAPEGLECKEEFEEEVR